MLTVVANKLCCYAATLHAGERVIGGAEWLDFAVTFEEGGKGCDNKRRGSSGGRIFA